MGKFAKKWEKCGKMRQKNVVFKRQCKRAPPNTQFSNHIFLQFLSEKTHFLSIFNFLDRFSVFQTLIIDFFSLSTYNSLISSLNNPET